LKCQNNLFRKPAHRNFSSHNPGPNPLVLTAAATTVAVGSTIAYARYDDQFRGQLKSNLPSFIAQNDWLLGAIEDSDKPLDDSKDLSLPFQKIENAILEKQDENTLDTMLVVDENTAAESSEYPTANLTITDVVAETELSEESAEVLITDTVNEQEVSEESLEALVTEAANEQDNAPAVTEVVETSEEVIDPTQAIDRVSTPEPEQPDELEAHAHVHTAVEVAEFNISEATDPNELEDLPAHLEDAVEPFQGAYEDVSLECVLEPAVAVCDDEDVITIPCEEIAHVEEIINEDETTPLQLEDVSCEIELQPEAVSCDDALALQEQTAAEEAAEKAAADEALRQLEEEEAEKAAAAAILQAFMSRGHSACEVAIDTGKEAASLAEAYVKEMEGLLSNLDVSPEQESSILEVLESFSDKKEKIIQKAVDLHAIAAKEFSQIENVLEHTKSSAKDLEEFKDAEEYLNKMKNVLSESTTSINAKIDEITSYNRMLAFYRRMVGSEPVSFIRLPEEEYNLSGANLNVPEMRRVIGFMRDHLNQLKDDVLAERRGFNDRLQVELEAACRETEMKVKALMDEEFAAKLEEIKDGFNAEKSENKVLHEEEIKHQLKRQAAAHVLHLTDALKYMQDQLDEEHTETLKKKMEEQATMFQETINNLNEKYEKEIRELNHDYAFKVSQAKARLEGFEVSVDVRSVYDGYVQSANNLALACSSLFDVMKANTVDSLSQPRSISAELEKVSLASKGDAALEAVISQIPTEVVSGGVFTEAALRTAFKSISKLCCRLSLVSESHNSIFTYALSYLKSVLISTVDEMEPPASIDTDQLDTFKIVSYANYCLQRGEVEQAARFVNQLTGTPRTVADTWLHEVRLHLETLHALDALSALSNAIIIGSQKEN